MVSLSIQWKSENRHSGTVQNDSLTLALCIKESGTLFPPTCDKGVRESLFVMKCKCVNIHAHIDSED